MSQPFKKRIGIVGGGQLGKMLIESSQKWNVEYNILDGKDAPCISYATKFVEGKLTDTNKIKELASMCDVITYEIEHINVEALLDLQKQGKTIIPSPEILQIIQNKGKQKDFYRNNNLPTSKYIIMNVKDIDDHISSINSIGGEKLVVKSCSGGYDGKGVYICDRTEVSTENISAIFDGEILIEEFIEGGIELAVIVARDQSGNIKTFPVVEMVFDPIKNLVDYLFAPANVDETLAQKACEISIEAINLMNGVGVFAVELFLDASNSLYINEIAPRPHNSGHHTIEACYTSQYEQLNRILLEMPLGDTTLRSPVIMTNIIGPENISGEYTLEGLDVLFNTPKSTLHWYNKAETRPGRKMGHFTVMQEDLSQALQLSKKIKEAIQITQI